MNKVFCVRSEALKHKVKTLLLSPVHTKHNNDKDIVLKIVLTPQL